MERVILDTSGDIYNNLDVIIDEMIKDYKNSGKSEILYCGVGTDKVIYDSIGCLVGSMLEEKSRAKKIKVYGTLESPIHGLNIEKRAKEIQAAHKDAFIIAVDSSVSNNKDSKFKDIIYRKSSVKAGKGAGKNLPSLGDVSIIGIINKEKGDNCLYLELANNVRLFDIMAMAKVITEIIINFEERLEDVVNE